MCGRARCTLRHDDIHRACHLTGRPLRSVDTDRYQPSYNVSPGRDLTVVRRDDGSGGDGAVLQCMKWGLIPSFTKKTEKPDHYKMFNARSESICEKASFRRLVPNNRCLVAVEGFYEWKKDGSKKQPYYVHFKDGRPLVFAALYDSWKNSEGEILYTFTIVTTSSSPALEWLHDRMPVILGDKESTETWLIGSSSSKFDTVLKPYEAVDLVWYPVTPAIGKASFDGPECIKEQGNSGKNTSVATRKRREILAKKNIGSTINYGMDSTGTKKSKNNAKATRRFWNKHEEDFLIGAMKDVFLSDPKWKRDNNQFRPGFYNLCEKKILLAFAGTDLRASPHIESKIKLWRKQYSTLYDMVNASGFGWDDCEKMVLVDSDDVWSNYVKRVPDAKGMRNKPFPYYEDWLILFGKDRATGELAEGPAESVAAMENEETIRGKGDESPVEQFWFNETDIDYSMSPSGNTTNPADSSKPPDSSKAGKKRVRPAAGISQGLSEMAVTFGAFFENTNSRMAEIAHRIGYSHDLSQQRRLVNTELLKLPMSTAQRLKVASMIVKDEERVDLFFSLEEDDKMEWVCMLLEGSII